MIDRDNKKIQVNKRMKEEEVTHTHQFESQRILLQYINDMCYPSNPLHNCSLCKISHQIPLPHIHLQ